jgi:hypothetical protein
MATKKKLVEAPKKPEGQPITVLIVAEDMREPADFEFWATMFEELSNELDYDDLTFGSEQSPDDIQGSILTAVVCMTLRTAWDVEALHNFLRAATDELAGKVEFIKQA